MAGRAAAVGSALDGFPEQPVPPVCRAGDTREASECDCGSSEVL